MYRYKKTRFFVQRSVHIVHKQTIIIIHYKHICVTRRIKTRHGLITSRTSHTVLSRLVEKAFSDWRGENGKGACLFWLVL